MVAAGLWRAAVRHAHESQDAGVATARCIGEAACSSAQTWRARALRLHGRRAAIPVHNSEAAELRPRNGGAVAAQPARARGVALLRRRRCRRCLGWQRQFRPTASECHAAQRRHTIKGASGADSIYRPVLADAGRSWCTCGARARRSVRAVRSVPGVRQGLRGVAAGHRAVRGGLHRGLHRHRGRLQGISREEPASSAVGSQSVAALGAQPFEARQPVRALRGKSHSVAEPRALPRTVTRTLPRQSAHGLGEASGWAAHSFGVLPFVAAVLPGGSTELAGDAVSEPSQS